VAVKEVVIVGARGQAKDLVSYLEADGGYRILCLIDEIRVGKVFGYDVVSPDDYDLSCRDAILAVGMPQAKVAVLAQYARFGFRWQGFIHRQSFLSPRARIGPGCILAPFVNIAGDACLGAHVYVGSFGGIGHDTVIGDCCSLLPDSGLGGGASLGHRSVLGAGARVYPGVTVGSDVRVSAGSVVRRNMPDGVLAHGNPARAVKAGAAARMVSPDSPE
jgi:acetyltransferase EpsM